MPGDYVNKVAEFHRFIIDVRETYFELGHVKNMDNVSLIFDVVSNTTVGVNRPKAVNVKTSGHGKYYTADDLSCCVD